MKFNIQNYLEISTIHGLAYIPKPFHIIERIFWIIALIVSIICTSILINELVIKIRNFPIVVYVAENSVPVSEIYFPAITVCPQLSPQFGLDPFTRKYLDSYYRYEKHTIRKYFLENEEYYVEIQDEIKFGNLSYVEMLNRLELGQLNVDKMGLKLLKRLHAVDILTKRNVFYNLNISVPTDNFLDVLNEFDKEFDKRVGTVAMNWINNMNQYISEVITPHGLCFTFNIAYSHDLLNLNATSDDFHYHHVLPESYTINGPYEPLHLQEIPRKLLTSIAGLSVSVMSIVNYNKGIIENTFNGYLFYFHDPFELPTRSTRSWVQNFNHISDIVIYPQMNIIDDSIAEYEPVNRNCYLENEKVLKFFKIYSKNNCETECLTEFMLGRCGCVEFFMIRNSTTRICSANERNCYEQAQNDFEEQKADCGCYRLCNYVKYDFEIVGRQMERNKKSKSFFMEVKAFFKFNDQFFAQLVSKEQFDTLDFLSFVGGVMGLFAGFSALSFIELIYWFTIRVCISNSKRFKLKIHPMGEIVENSGRLKTLILSYFNESSIHGLQYVFGFTKIDSIIWIICILLSLTFCFDLMLSAPEKVPDSRVIAYEDSMRFVDNIPFPAFTLVPQYMISKISKKRFSNPEQALKKINPLRNNEKAMEDYLKNSTRYYFCDNMYNGQHIGMWDNLMPYHFDVLKEDSMAGWFRKQFTSFNHHLQPPFAEIRTSRGMGFTFNLIDADEMFDFEQISYRFNYTTNITTNSINSKAIPMKFKSPIKFSRIDRPILTLKLTQEVPKTHQICLNMAFLVHHSDYLPTFAMRHEFFSFDPGMIVNVEIHPEITRTDEDLKSLSPDVRECYFEGEMILKYFNKYSQRNCEIECLAELTYNHSGGQCVDIDQPFRDEAEICSFFMKHPDAFYPFYILNEFYVAGNFTFEQNCSCLPMCNSVTYNLKYFAEFFGEDTETTINVRMNMEDIVLFRRYQQFTFSDVVSYVGGLLGLFAGISMLSIVEFLYFFTIRIGVDLWRWIKWG